MDYNLSFLGIMVRFSACLLWVLLAAFTDQFVFYCIGVLTLVMALTGYDPMVDLMNKKKIQKTE